MIDRILIGLGHAVAAAALVLLGAILLLSVWTGNWTYIIAFDTLGEGKLEAIVVSISLFGFGLGYGRTLSNW